MRLTWMIGAVALGMAIGGPAMAQDARWSVRVCRGQNEASAIKITASDGKTTKQVVNWQSDNKKTDFAVPAPLAKAPKLTIVADSEPADGKVAMCVFWGKTPAKTMKFNDLLSVDVATGDTDDSCPCK